MLHRFYSIDCNKTLNATQNFNQKFSKFIIKNLYKYLKEST